MRTGGWSLSTYTRVKCVECVQCLQSPAHVSMMEGVECVLMPLSSLFLKGTAGHRGHFLGPAPQEARSMGSGVISLPGIPSSSLAKPFSHLPPTYSDTLPTQPNALGNLR